MAIAKEKDDAHSLSFPLFLSFLLSPFSLSPSQVDCKISQRTGTSTRMALAVGSEKRKDDIHREREERERGGSSGQMTAQSDNKRRCIMPIPCVMPTGRMRKSCAEERTHRRGAGAASMRALLTTSHRLTVISGGARRQMCSGATMVAHTHT